MFEIIKRIFEIRGKNVIQEIGEDNWKAFQSCYYRDVENRNLSVLKKYAEMLDLPVGFLISISKYGGIENERVGQSIKRSNGILF